MTAGSAPAFHRLLHRAVAEIIPPSELERMLRSGQILRIKQGFDPSRPDLHLGHAVGLRKLRQFQELGHHVVLVVGDWTARIGDPSGLTTGREPLTAEEVRANARTYMEQFFKIVDRTLTEVVWQSQWYGSFSLADVFDLAGKFTVAQMLSREDFARRYASGRPIALTEFLYPLLQAYDSVMVRADVEVGGMDQKFNILLGRDLQESVGQSPQQAVLVPLLIGTDGQHKMSKSLDNYIALTDPPAEMYGKVMSIPDDLIMSYFELLTDVPDEELAEFRAALERRTINPMGLKQRLARVIVTEFHSLGEAVEAEEEFSRVFRRREMPSEIPEVLLDSEWFGVPVRPPDLLVVSGLASTRSEARRLVGQGGMRIDGEKVDVELVTVSPGTILRVGQRRFVRLLMR